jgi:hypothetical protein
VRPRRPIDLDFRPARPPNYLLTPKHVLDGFNAMRQANQIALAAYVSYVHTAPDSPQATQLYARYEIFSAVADQWETVILAWLRRENGIDPPLPGHIRDGMRD